MVGHGLGYCRSRQGQVVGCCKHVNELEAPSNVGNLLTSNGTVMFSRRIFFFHGVS